MLEVSLELKIPMIFGVKVTFNQLNTVYDGLLGRINQERDSVCLVLHLTNVNIRDWYEDIIERFSAIPRSELTFVDQERSNLEKFFKKRERTDLAEKSKVMLDDLIQRHKSDTRGFKLIGDIKDKLHITTVQNVRIDMLEFVESAVLKKAEWWKDFSHNDYTWRISTDENRYVGRKVRPITGSDKYAGNSHK